MKRETMFFEFNRWLYSAEFNLHINMNHGDPMTVLEMSSAETKFLSEMRDGFCRKLRERCGRYRFRPKEKIGKEKDGKKWRIKRARKTMEFSLYAGRAD